MSRTNSDQLHRSTLMIYANLTDEFNPSLQKLILLGNRYVQAFKTFAASSEAYFSALSKIGERAFNTKSSQSIGETLIQMSESQRVLMMEVEKVFRQFNVDVLQEMENNVQLDKAYIMDSRKHYEMDVRSQADALERQPRRGVGQESSEYVKFLKRSHDAALREQERRHRFLAEKHCGLIQSIGQLMNKSGGSLQQRADAWTNEVNVTRGLEARRPSVFDDSMGMKDEMSYRNREEPILGHIPSRAPSPQGSISSFTVSGSVRGGGGGGGRYTKALVDHQPSSSQSTLLPFSRGEIITVLIKQPKNGWLYGRAESSSRPGWFPATYVEEVDDPPNTASPRGSTPRSISSLSNRFDQPNSRSQSTAAAAAAPPPPPPPPSSSDGHSAARPVTLTPDRRAESKSDNKGSKPYESRPELFPRGTNPFATVKLKPTTTDDRSAPRLNRR